MRAGQGVADAMEDIIQRGVAELRKNAFGDDSEDARGLSWTRQQAWTVLKLLAQKDEVCVLDMCILAKLTFSNIGSFNIIKLCLTFLSKAMKAR